MSIKHVTGNPHQLLHISNIWRYKSDQLHQRGSIHRHTSSHPHRYQIHGNWNLWSGADTTSEHKMGPSAFWSWTEVFRHEEAEQDFPKSQKACQKPLGSTSGLPLRCKAKLCTTSPHLRRLLARNGQPQNKLWINIVCETQSCVRQTFKKGRT